MINNPMTGGIDTSDANATAADMGAGKTAYVDGVKVSGIAERRESGSAGYGYSGSTVSQSGSELVLKHGVSGNGILYKNGSNMQLSAPLSNLGTASASQVLSGASFTSSAGLKKTGTISSRGASTITPGRYSQSIPSGVYLSGQQTISGDANLLPENIKSGVSIFGTQGTLQDERSAYFTDRYGSFFNKNWYVSFYPQMVTQDHWSVYLTITLSGMGQYLLDIARIVSKNLYQPIDAQYAVMQGDILWKASNGGVVSLSFGGGYGIDAWGNQYNLTFQSIDVVDSGGIVTIRVVANPTEYNNPDGFPQLDWYNKCNIRFVALMK